MAPSSGSLSLRLRASWRLTSHVTATRRLIMQKARHHGTRPALTACRRTVSGTISLPCYGCVSPCPHGTCPLAVSGECLALADGPGRFAQDSSWPAVLRIPLCCSSLHILDYHRLWSHLPQCSVHDLHTVSRSYDPAGALRRRRFGRFPVRSPLLGESLFIFSSCRY